MKNTVPEVMQKDPLLASRSFDVPTEGYLGSRIDANYNPVDIQTKRNDLLVTLAQAFADFSKDAYLALDPDSQNEFSQAMGVRALKNILLAMIARQGDESAFELADAQYKSTKNMSERLGALRVLVWNDAPQAEAALIDFYLRFKDEALSMTNGLWCKRHILKQMRKLLSI